ncbi:MAG: hypothetical protein HY077_04080 [Elusimicrobia bacterium]|nr:hypothetical protein [Elusimicrobiota bacterium]
MQAAAVLLLALPALSQQPAPAASTDAAVGVSSGPAVALSTGAAEAEGHGVSVAGEQPKAIFKNPIAVRLHKESADWEPVSLRVGGDPAQAANSFTRLLRQKRKPSKAKASARVHAFRGDTMLVISLYPDSLKKLGMHIEVRYLLVEGWLEEVKIAAVTLRAGQSFEYGAEDSFSLARKGLSFREDFPAEAEVKVSALNPRPGSGSRNGGRVKGADFGGDELGVVDFSYGTAGVASDKRR